VSDTRYIYTLRARHSDETLREADRNCLLLRAAAQGQLPRVQHLLRLGADVDFADDSGFTALHHAVSSGFEDCVQELIKEGADVNNVTSCGVALNIAADKGRDRVAEILLRARADCDEAIAFAEEKGLDFEVLEGFLTQAVQSSGVESPWTTHSGASNNHNGTPTDIQETGGDVDASEPSDGPRSTTPMPQKNETIVNWDVDKYAYYPRITEPSSHTNGTLSDGDLSKSAHDTHSTRNGSHNASADERARTLDNTKITRSSGSSFDQASSIKTFFRMLTGRNIGEPTGELGLTTLHIPSGGVDHATADLIFIHGIGGGSRETWTTRGDPSTF
jgi:hypothetical protein